MNMKKLKTLVELFRDQRVEANSNSEMLSGITTVRSH